MTGVLGRDQSAHRTTAKVDVVVTARRPDVSSRSQNASAAGVYSDTTQLNSNDPVEQRTAKSVVFLFMTSRPTN